MKMLGGSKRMTRSKGWSRVRVVFLASLAAIVVALATGGCRLDVAPCERRIAHGLDGLPERTEPQLL